MQFAKKGQSFRFGPFSQVYRLDGSFILRVTIFDIYDITDLVHFYVTTTAIHEMCMQGLISMLNLDSTFEWTSQKIAFCLCNDASGISSKN